MEGRPLTQADGLVEQNNGLLDEVDGLRCEMDEGGRVSHLVDYGGPSVEAARPHALREARLRNGVGADGRQRHKHYYHHDEEKACLMGKRTRGIRETRGALTK